MTYRIYKNENVFAVHRVEVDGDGGVALRYENPQIYVRDKTLDHLRDHLEAMLVALKLPVIEEEEHEKFVRENNTYK
jgi:hypothetical protein